MCIIVDQQSVKDAYAILFFTLKMEESLTCNDGKINWQSFTANTEIDSRAKEKCF